MLKAHANTQLPKSSPSSNFNKEESFSDPKEKQQRRRKRSIRRNLRGFWELLCCLCSFHTNSQIIPLNRANKGVDSKWGHLPSPAHQLLFLCIFWRFKDPPTSCLPLQKALNGWIKAHNFSTFLSLPPLQLQWTITPIISQSTYPWHTQLDDYRNRSQEHLGSTCLGKAASSWDTSWVHSETLEDVAQREACKSSFESGVLDALSAWCFLADNSLLKLSNIIR